MGRQKEFDRNEALDAALRLFWAQGFAASSTDALMKTMGISRQSMYDTFGDKRSLYLEALQRYTADSVGAVLGHLHKSDTPLDGVARALSAFAAKAVDESALGCMGVNAVCEFGRSDSGINTITDMSARTLERALEHRLNEAKACGEMATDTDVRAATQFLMATLSGMKVSAKGGADAKTLRDIAAFALRSLAPSRPQADPPKKARAKR